MCAFSMNIFFFKIKPSKNEIHHISEFYGLHALLIEKEKTILQAVSLKMLSIRKDDFLVQ